MIWHRKWALFWTAYTMHGQLYWKMSHFSFVNDSYLGDGSTLKKGKKLRNSNFSLVFVIKFELHHFEKLIFCIDPYIYITVRIRTICKANNPEIRAGIKLIVNKLLKLPDPNHWYSPNRYWMFTTTIFCSSTICSGCSLFEDSQNDSVNSNSTNFTNRFLVL